MKILLVTTDGDYGACLFEDTIEDATWPGIWDEAKASKNGQLTKELEADGEMTEFQFEAHEFGEVDPKFIDFLRDQQDYDDSKHKNWFVIP